MFTPTRRQAIAAAPLALLAPRIARAQTVTATPLKVMVFPGLGNLPLFAAQENGIFARRGLAIEILNTPNSQELREGLAAGRHQIVHGGVDNAVAMAEGGTDIAVFLGGDNGYNRLFVQPEIQGFADLRGKTVIVDAPDTAYALVLYKMMAMNGLPRGSYEVKLAGATFARLEVMLRDRSVAATMLNPPFSLRAEEAGLRPLATATDVVGPYLANSAWTLRAWARENPEVLVRYIQSVVEGLRWSLNPANAEPASALLASRLRLPADAARRNLALMAHPETGYARDARFDMEGFHNVLRIRAETLGTWGGTPPAPERYLDLAPYERALATM